MNAELLSMLAQTNEQASSSSTVLSLGVNILSLVGMWFLFFKADEAGWKCIVPFLNIYVLFKIVYGNGWKMFLLLVPILNIVVAFALNIRMAQVFGKSTLYGIGMCVPGLSTVLYLILAFGQSTYRGPVYSFI